MALRIPHLTWARSFEAAARHRSFTAAARELHMTQAAVSKQIRLLESHLGSALFLRKANGLELTATARAWLPIVEDALQRLQRGTEEVFGTGQTQVLRLQIIESFAVQWLAPRLPRFQTLFPDIELRLSSSSWADEALLRDADLDIRYGLEPWDGVRADRLTREHLTPLLSPEKASQVQRPEDLSGERLIHVLGYQDGWGRWLHGLGIEQDFAALQVDTSLLAHAMAMAGLGVALGRSSLAAPLLQSGALIAPFKHTLAVDEGFFLISPTGTLPAAAAHFRDWILDEAGRGPSV